MTAAISTLALFTPIIASNAVFSVRRASRGIDSIDENPLFALANFDISAAQVLKGGRALKAAALLTNPELSTASNGAAEAIKNVSKSSKILKTAGKIVNFTADHVNPVIIGAGVLKVAGSDNKVDAAARETLALGTMFAAEGAAKKILGMPKVNGVGVKGNPFVEKQLSALTEYCSEKQLFNKISLKPLPGALKGLAFVTASILGYKLGNTIADKLLGKDELDKATC